MRKLRRGLSQLKIKDLPESFFLMEQLRNSTSAVSSISVEYINRLYVKLDKDNTDCPKKLLPGMDLCPGYKVMDFDRFRIPRMMLQVKCKCKSCVGRDDSSTHCTPMYYYTRVLRVTDCDDRGFYVYNYHWEKVSNGCVCKGRRKAPQLPQ
ncbi:interleukin 17-like protein [Saccostrea echinata]|uniref:interleukin 17-like protein n=1 Tax=Saccostrea echinata TaxID=191078 RepID=UPI002A818693|nr:interleukin 17-like protein [Saccostrea echinata]